jgi:hypothetical protein
MGMNRFTSHSTTPTATIVMMTVVSGISSSPIIFPEPVDTQGIFEQFERFEFELLSYFLPTFISDDPICV